MSSTLHAALLFLHVLSVVVWIGGMAFSHLCLRPAILHVLEGSQRLRLWQAVFERFFPLVWVAVTLILASGAALLAHVGMAQAPRGWHAMLLLGTVMAAVFVNVQLGPYAAFRRAMATEDWAAAAAQQGRIRARVSFNLVLGIATIACATLGLAF